VTLLPRPVQKPIEMWLGGTAQSELRRAGRLADGWIPSFCTLDDVAAGWPVINEVAAQNERSIDPEHLGVLIAYTHHGVPDLLRAFLARRRPELDAAEVVPVGIGSLRERIEAFIGVGASKFVVVPIEEPPSWDDELEAIAATLKPLET
jgi:alkanesulfonate monooxygenase SsuD/methylene tetrahydromethanopterin reductase-like flavin-dependent oxidoreductase (luciferase family)